MGMLSGRSRPMKPSSLWKRKTVTLCTELPSLSVVTLCLSRSKTLLRSVVSLYTYVHILFLHNTKDFVKRPGETLRQLWTGYRSMPVLVPMDLVSVCLYFVCVCQYYSECLCGLYNFGFLLECFCYCLHLLQNNIILPHC